MWHARNPSAPFGTSSTEGRPVETERLRKPVATAVILSAAAGFIDVYIYLHVAKAFGGNLSGNLVHLGMDVGNGAWLQAAHAGFAIVSFVVGIVITTRFQGKDRVRYGLVRTHRNLAGEAAILLLLAIILISLDGLSFARLAWVTLPVVGMAAIAMGIQTASLTRISTVAVATTYETGTLVRIGQNLLSPVGPERESSDQAKQRRRLAAIMTAIIVSYVAGATVSITSGSAPALTLIPAAAVASTALLMRPKRAAKSSDGTRTLS